MKAAEAWTSHSAQRLGARHTSGGWRCELSVCGRAVCGIQVTGRRWPAVAVSRERLGASAARRAPQRYSERSAELAAAGGGLQCGSKPNTAAARQKSAENGSQIDLASTHLPSVSKSEPLSRREVRARLTDFVLLLPRKAH